MGAGVLTGAGWRVRSLSLMGTSAANLIGGFSDGRFRACFQSAALWLAASHHEPQREPVPIFHEPTYSPASRSASASSVGVSQTPRWRMRAMAERRSTGVPCRLA